MYSIFLTQRLIGMNNLVQTLCYEISFNKINNGNINKCWGIRTLQNTSFLSSWFIWQVPGQVSKKIKGKQSLSKHTIRHFGWFFRIHSLSLQDLRQFIDPDAPKTNGIPTINFDQTSDNVILNNTRDDPNLFAASGLRAFDSVLSHVKNLQYEIAKGKY